MALLNLSVNLVAYADELKNINPGLKFCDFNWSLLGLPTDNPKTVPFNLNPGEIKTVLSTQRTLTFTGLTSFDIEKQADGVRARLKANIAARTARSDGDATTEWAITLNGNTMRLTYTGTGLAPVFGGMVSGDGITIDAPFNASNQGDFTIVKVGASYIEVINAVATPETTVGQIQIYSSGPVQVGDILDLTASQFSYTNRGQFQILRVTDSFIEYSNENALTETGITGVTTGLVIYTEAYKWSFAAVDRRSIFKLNGDTGTGNEVEPPVEADLVKNPGLFLKRGKIFEIQIENPTLYVLTGFVFLAE